MEILGVTLRKQDEIVVFFMFFSPPACLVSFMKGLMRIVLFRFFRVFFLMILVAVGILNF